MMNRAAILMLKLAEQLGFTPVSRPRLVAEQPASSDGDPSRWLNVMHLARRRPSNQP
jgi:hypothetical protein